MTRTRRTAGRFESTDHDRAAALNDADSPTAAHQVDADSPDDYADTEEANK